MMFDFQSCIDLAATSVLIYDYVLTIDQEVTLIWSSTFSFMNILFALTRYIPLANTVPRLYYQLKVNTLLKLCKTTRVISAWLQLLSFIFAELILVVRTWSLLNGRRKRSLAIYVASCIALVAGGIMVEIIFLRSMKYDVPQRPTPEYVARCPSVSGSPILGLNIILVMLAETIFLVLLLIKAVEIYRLGHSIRGIQGLTYILYRDGILFYVYLFVASTVNLVLILTLPKEKADMLVIIQSVLHSTLSARVILNLRQASRSAAGVATVPSDWGRLPTPVVFRAPTVSDTINDPSNES